MAYQRQAIIIETFNTLSINKRNSKMRALKEEISVEDYLRFFHSQKRFDFTVNFLNQIIVIHGFKKILQRPKKVLTEAIETIDLLNLSRSTLRDNGMSSCAFINLEDVIADLNDLNWQDCRVTSIQTLNSPKDDFSSNTHATDTANHSLGLSSKSTADCHGADVVALAPGSSSNGGSTTGRGAPKLGRKRKREGGRELGSPSSGLASLGSC
ncbi:uncharacterized protein LOC110626894 [Manihot esculenta]|uniref:DUF7787 domain-containing protein n=1 Tax=Manihot esculenta TaxID=3983 RepID=A0A2C9WLS3_MANES|nr:uncharacterized protein LOC110626894 [Manihot esculenta]OAY60712.1 hypothetical protein MANES_01G133300v8 [Manihot esculenta]